VHRLTVLSMHTSPLAQPGRGDCGGMNVYVRQLSTALARSGVQCDAYTRAWAPDLAAVVHVEPGLRIHHVVAGPLAEIPKEELPVLIPEFTSGVLSRMESGQHPDAIHANYWLSGLVGHELKHELGRPLMSTFHTLARVKGEPDEGDAERRARAEAGILGCSDAVLASSLTEAEQISSYYEVERARIEVVPPGVDHAFFSPGDKGQARRALGLSPTPPMLLFVGRIQPLKGVSVAIRALDTLDRTHGHQDAFMVVVGGPSGSQGEAELAGARRLVRQLGLNGRVRLVEPQPHELLSTYYRAADVCLMPSRSESFGLVALEAAACGTPVVASAVGGLRSLVDHGKTGFLVDGRDHRGFAAYVSALLRNPTGAAEISLNAAERARRYTWSSAAELMRVLLDAISDRSPVEC
jgi:D-inositol-3-phosphate glycosyltransferase